MSQQEIKPISNREKLYNNLIETGRVSEREIGKKEDFINALGNPSGAKYVYDNLRSKFDPEEIGDETKFLGFVTADYTGSLPAGRPGGNLPEPTEKAVLPAFINTNPFLPKDNAPAPLKEKANTVNEKQQFVDVNKQGQQAAKPTVAGIEDEMAALYDKHKDELAMYNSIKQKMNIPEVDSFTGYNARESRMMGLGGLLKKAKISKEERDFFENNKERLEDVERQMKAMTIRRDVTNLVEQQESLDPDSSGVKKFWDGLTKSGTVKDFLTMGLSTMKDDVYMIELLEKASKDKNSINPEEQKLIDSYMKLQEMQSKDNGFWYGAGRSFREMVPFVINMIATGGVAGAVNLGQKAIATSFKAATKLGKKKAIEYAARKAGSLMLGNMLRTPFTTTFYTDLAKRRAGNYSQDEQGNIQKGDNTFLGDLYKSSVVNTLEYMTEGFGDLVGRGALTSLLAKKRILGPLSKYVGALEKITKNPTYKEVGKVLDMAQIHGISTEIFVEEVPNALLSSLLTGSDDYKSLADPEFYGTIAVNTALMGGIFKGTQFVSGGVASSIERGKINNVAKKANNTLQREIEAIDDADVSTAASELQQAISNDDYFNPDNKSESGVINAFQNFRKVVESKYETNPEQYEELFQAASKAVLSNAEKAGAYEGLLAIAEEEDGGPVAMKKSPDNVVIATGVNGDMFYITDVHQSELGGELFIVRNVKSGEMSTITPDVIEDTKSIATKDWLEAWLQTREVIKPAEDAINAENEASLQQEDVADEPVNISEVVPGAEFLIGDERVVVIDATEEDVFVVDRDGNEHRAEIDSLQRIPATPQVPETAAINAEAEASLPEEAQQPVTEQALSVDQEQSPENLEQEGASIAAPVEDKISFPVDKQGQIDYSQITEPKIYAEALKSEFADDSMSTLEDLIAEQNEALKKAQKATNAIERRRKIKVVNDELARLNQVKALLSPEQSAAPSQAIQSQSAQQVPKMRPAQRNAIGKKLTPMQADLKAFGEPTTREEAVAMKILSEGIKFKMNDSKAEGLKGLAGHLGIKKGTTDYRKYFGLQNESTGVTPEAFALYMKETDDTGLFSNVDDIDILTDVLEVLRKGYSRRTIFNIIDDNRKALSRKFDEENYYDPQQEQQRQEASKELSAEEYDEIIDDYFSEKYVPLSEQEVSTIESLIADSVKDEERWRIINESEDLPEDESGRNIAEGVQQRGADTDVSGSPTIGNNSQDSNEGGSNESTGGRTGADEAVLQGAPVAQSEQSVNPLRKEIESLNQSKKEAIAERDRLIANSAERVGLFGDTKQDPNDLFGGEGFDPSASQPLVDNQNKIIAELDRKIEVLTKNLEKGEKEAQGQLKIEEIAQEEARVNTEPTEKQKEAGNYQKGHIKLLGYDVTIEQPKGSTRSGVDKGGKEWSVTMNNTYGYILGTKGKDGDHIDVFVGENPLSEKVYVVDQVNQDGSFDEHKVMFGFDSIEDASKAYNANYEEGWQGLGYITEVSIDDFQKWTENKTRKIKPFAEYKQIRSERPFVDTPIEEIESRVSEYEAIINEREENLKNSNTPITGSNTGVGTLTEAELSEFAGLTSELQRRNTISADEAKLRVEEKKKQRLAQLENKAPIEPKFEFMADSPMRQARAIQALSKRTSVEGVVMKAHEFIESLEKGLKARVAKVYSKKSDKGYIERLAIGDWIVDSKAEQDYYTYLQDGGISYTQYLSELNAFEALKKQKEDSERRAKREIDSIRNRERQEAYAKQKKATIKVILSGMTQDEFLNTNDQLLRIREQIGKLRSKKNKTKDIERQLIVEENNLRGMEFRANQFYEAAKSLYEIRDGEVVEKYSYSPGDRIIVDYGDGRVDETEYMGTRENNDGSITHIVKPTDIIINGYVSYDMIRPFIEENQAYPQNKEGLPVTEEVLFRDSGSDYQNEIDQIKQRSIADGTFMKAPNGKPTNLNEYQWLQVRTKAFKKWFGDWEKTPTSASKIVDDNGEPLVVYHGTPNRDNFTKFDVSKIGSANDDGVWGSGFYFSRLKKHAEEYREDGKGATGGGSIYPSFLSIKNPFQISDFKTTKEMADYLDIVESNFVEESSGIRISYSQINQFTSHVIDKGHDGVIVSRNNEIVAFSPNQIKSAIDNTGEFSTETDDIRFRQPYFYSPTEQALNSIKQEKGTPEQWKAMLLKNGAKEAEMEWMGWEDFVDEKKSLTKTDIQEWIDGNRIEVKEVVKGAEELNPVKLNFKRIENYDIRDFYATIPSSNEIEEVYEDDEVGYKIAKTDDGFYYVLSNYGDNVFKDDDYSKSIASLIDAEAVAGLHLAEQNKSIIGNNDDTQYSKYTIPGGEKYKELLLTMPSVEQTWKNIDDFKEAMRNKYGDGWKSKMSASENNTFESLANGESKRLQQDFKSSHFDESNILAHIRFNERRSVNGERVLFIEEIQSDWAQKGKKEGFKGKKEWGKADRIYADFMKRMEAKYGKDWAEEYTKEEYDEEYTLLEERDKAERSSVPDMPFKNTDQWVNLALRRALIYAAENGFDRIAWTNGEMQAERYDLSKQVDEIEYVKTDDKYDLKVRDKNGNPVIKGLYPENELENIVGKEIANKIIKGEGKEHSDKTMSLKGVDLKVGGEGMKAFYDNIIPAQANKIGKKFGAKVETTEIPAIDKKVYDNDTEEVSLTPEAEELYQKYMDSVAEDDGSYPIEQYVSDMENIGYEVVLNENGEPIDLKKTYKGEVYSVQSIPITPAIKEQAAIGMPLYKASDKISNIPVKDLMDYANSFAEKLGVKIKVIPDSLDYHEKSVYRRSRGWFVPRTGEVVVVLNKHESLSDLQATILHEVVGHKGLRSLLGDTFNATMERVFNSIPRAARVDYFAKYGDRVTSAEEYLSELAEKDIKPNVWQRIKAIIRDAFRAIGVNISLNDADMVYMLWRSKNRLKNQSEATTTEVMTDIAKSQEAKSQASKFKPSEKELFRPENREPFTLDTNDITLNKWERSIEALQDRMISGKKLLEEVKKRGGKVGVFSNFVSEENRSSSRAKAELDDFEDNYYKPILDIVAKWAKEGKSADEISLYMMAKHAPERNRHIVIRDARESILYGFNKDLRKAEGKRRSTTSEKDIKAIDESIRNIQRQIDFINSVENAGLIAEIMKNAYDVAFNHDNRSPLPEGMDSLSYMIALNIQKRAISMLSKVAESELSNNRSGLSDEEAADIVNEFEKGLKEVKDVVMFWDNIRKATRFSLDKSLKYGLISNELHAATSNMYEFYVPLRSWAEKEDIDYQDVFGDNYLGHEILNPVNKQAEGRTSLADNPLGFIASMAETSIVAGSKNEVRRNAWRLIKNNDHMTDLFLIKQAWEVNIADIGDEPIWETTYEPPTQELIDAGMARRLSPNKTYEWHKSRGDIEKHQVPVLIDGSRVLMEFKGPVGTRVAAAINGDDVVRWKRTEGIARLTRIMAALKTSKNPDFMLTNFLRDFFFGTMAYNARGGSALVMTKNLGRAWGAIHKDFTNGKEDPYLKQMYEDFKMNGGETGYVHMLGEQDYKKKVEKLVKEANKAGSISPALYVKKAIKVIDHGLDYLAHMSENAVRFSTYLTEVEAQMKKQKSDKPTASMMKEAALMAKEVTTNFNRKGKWSSQVNSFYAFFNASVQGSANYIKLAKENPKGFVLYNMAMMSVRTAFAAWCYSLIGGDDEEKGYQALSDYIKENNFVIPAGDGKFITIPLPHGARALTSIGPLALDVAMGKKNAAEAMEAYSKNIISELSPINLVGLDKSAFIPRKADEVLLTMLPTVVRPFAETALNLDFMSRPIERKNFLATSDDYLPRFRNAYSSTNPILVGLSRELNKAFGGNENRSAAVRVDKDGMVSRSKVREMFDISPAYTEHIIEGYFGGLGRFVNDLYKTTRSAVHGEVPEKQNIPVVRRLYQEPYESVAWQKYFETRARVSDITMSMKAAKDTGDMEQYVSLNNYYNNSLITTFEIYNDIMKNISSNIKSLPKNDPMRKQAEKAMDKLVEQFNEEIKFIDKNHNRR